MRWAIVGLCASACANFGEAGPTSASDAGADAGPPGLDGAAGDGARPEPEPEPGGDDLFSGAGAFENHPRCADGWSAFQGSLSNSTPSHAGENSCLVCRSGTFDTFTLNSRVFATAKLGDRYHIEAWIRRVGPGPKQAFVNGRAWTAPSVERPSATGYDVIGDEWQRITHELEIVEFTSAKPQLDAYVSFHDFGTEAKVCILVDDFRVWKTN